MAAVRSSAVRSPPPAAGRGGAAASPRPVRRGRRRGARGSSPSASRGDRIAPRDRIDERRDPLLLPRSPFPFSCLMPRSPFPSVLPDNSAGGLLGLFNSSARGARAPLVAVEFDTYKNDWDPSDDHVGFDLGGIVSAATADWPTSMKDGRKAHARVEYDATARNFTVALSYGDTRPAATDVLLWYAVLWFVRQWRKAGELVDGDIDMESGPRRFRYGELAAATRNFAEDRKLGQGGFGAVYRDFLRELGLAVAIKRVSKGSTQGRKEYAAEVCIISQLRHRHLVRLVGWCHEHRGDFLLVYEHMPNGSVGGGGVVLPYKSYKWRGLPG